LLLRWSSAHRPGGVPISGEITGKTGGRSLNEGKHSHKKANQKFYLMARGRMFVSIVFSGECTENAGKYQENGDCNAGLSGII